MEDERKATEAAKLHERTEEQARVREAARRDALAPQASRQDAIDLTAQNAEPCAAQEAPDASRARYFELYDLAPVGYCTVSEHGLILEANLTAATFLGLARPDLVRRPCSEFILAEDQDLHDRHWKQLFETGQPQAFELRMLKQDGSEFWARLVATTGPSEDGERTGCVVMSDIDERRRAERMRIRSEAKFGAVFRATPDAYFLTSVPDGRIIEVNTAATRLAGFGAEEMLGRTTTELDLWADPAARDEYMARVRRDGAVRDFETQFRVRSGALIDGMISGEIIQLDEGPCFLSVIRDVTESKRAERRLVTSEGGLRSIIDNIQDAYFRADLSGRFTMVSPSAARMYGYGSVDEMIGLPAEALYGNRQERTSIVDEMGKAGRVDDYVGLGRRKDGTTFWVSMNAQFCRDASGNIIGTEGFVRDITERRRAEDALRTSLEHLRIAQVAARAGVWSWDMVTGTLSWSPEFFQLFGLDPSASASFETWLASVHPEDRALASSRISRAVEERTPLTNEYRIVLAGGQTRWILAAGDNGYDIAGKPCRMTGICIDITERKQMENALAKKLDELERFNQAMVGRELRMVELKREINELLAAAGQPPKYKIHG